MGLFHQKVFLICCGIKKPSAFLLDLLKVLKSKNINNPVFLRDVIDAYVTLNLPGKYEEVVKDRFDFVERKGTEELIEELLKKVEEENIK